MKKSKLVIIGGGGGDGQPKESVSWSSFGFKVSHVAVSQTCQSVGFQGSQTLALDVLSNIAALYLQSIAKLATCSANTNSRTQSNLNDVIFAIQDLSSSKSPAAAVIKDLIYFVKYIPEIPFAQPLPFPTTPKFITTTTNNNNNGAFLGGRLSYVPRWLPHVPPAFEEQQLQHVKNKDPKWGCLLDVHHNHRGDGNAITGRGTLTTTTPLLGGILRDRVRFSIGGLGNNNNNTNNNNNNGGDVKGGGLCRGGGGIGKKRVLCTSCCWSEDTELLPTKNPR